MSMEKPLVCWNYGGGVEVNKELYYKDNDLPIIYVDNGEDIEWSCIGLSVDNAEYVANELLKLVELIKNG